MWEKQFFISQETKYLRTPAYRCLQFQNLFWSKMKSFPWTSCHLSSRTHWAWAEGTAVVFVQQRLTLHTKLVAAYTNVTEWTIAGSATPGMHLLVFYFTVSKLKEAEKFLLLAFHLYLPEREKGFPWCPTQFTPCNRGQQSRQGATVSLYILPWPYGTLHCSFFWHLQLGSFLSVCS